MTTPFCSAVKGHIENYYTLCTVYTQPPTVSFPKNEGQEINLLSCGMEMKLLLLIVFVMVGGTEEENSIQ